MRFTNESMIKLGCEPTKHQIRAKSKTVITSVKRTLVVIFGVPTFRLTDKIAIDLFISKYRIECSDDAQSKMIACYKYCIANKTIHHSLKVKKIKTKTKPKKEKAKRVRVPHEFYDSEDWQLLRKKTIRAYGCVCMKCKAKNIEMHVDHIKPRSRYPELELNFDNLQVLCRRCNMDKSDNNEIDYRPKTVIKISVN